MISLRATAWPMLGRTVEAAAVRAAMSEAAGAVLWGPAGIGKTTLTRAVLAELQQSAAGPRVVHLFTPLTSIATPWEVFAPLLGGRQASSADPIRTLLSQAVAELDDPMPALLVVDDVHDLDEASATILAELVHGDHALLLATCRPEPGLPGPLVPLWRQHRIRRIDVAPLDRRHTEELVETVLSGPVARSTGTAIWRVTAGNPLYVRELLASLTDSGALAQVGADWVWRDHQDVGARVRDLITAELDELPRAERDLVDLLALAGPTRVDLLPGPVDDAAVSGARSRGLVTFTGTGVPAATLRLAHPVHGEVIRSTLGRDRREKLFTAFSRPAADGATPAELFRWVDWALTCRVRPSTEAVLRATQEAARLGDAALVRRLGAVALDALPPVDTRRIEVLLLRAESERFGGQRQLAADDLHHAGRLLQECEDALEDPDPAGCTVERAASAGATDQAAPGGAAHGDDLRLRHAEAHADLLQYHDDDLDRALSTLAAVPLRTAAVRDRRDVSVLVRLGYAGQFAACLPEMERLCATEAPSGHQARVLGPLVLGLAQSGRLTEAVATADRFLRAWSVDADRYPWVLSELLAARFMACLWIGDLDRATHPPLHHEDQQTRSNDAVDQVGTARFHAAQADWSAAARHYRGALTGFAIRDPSGLEALAWAGLAQVSAAVGDRDGASSASRHYRAAATRTSRALAADSELLLLTAAVTTGEKDAPMLADRLAEASTAGGLWLSAARARHLQVVLDPHRSGGASELASAAAHVDAPWAPVLTAHGQALCAGDHVLAGRLAAQLAAVGIWLPTPAVTPHLTPRQRQIAELVVAGLTNREIAERLVVSVRTVDTHVAHIFARLNIGSRADLTLLVARSARG